jgi:hypothetical protein
MAELKDEWVPRPCYTEPGWQSWVLCDASEAQTPWAWITTKNDNQYRLYQWAGNTWEPHAVFDTLEAAQAVGRIVGRIAMERLGT